MLGIHLGVKHMGKYAITNILFTITFLAFFTPLCYLLYDYVSGYGFSPASAKELLSDSNISPISVNRDFSQTEKGHAKNVTVLMYHQIIPEDQLNNLYVTEDGKLVDTVVTLEEFTKQMDYLKEHNYTVLSLKEFELFMTSGKKVPAKSVLITIDDGFKNAFEFAYPVLKEHGFYAVHFMITGMITDKTVPYNSSKLQYASIEELKKASDVFDYGNHTHSFHRRDQNEVAYLRSFGKDEAKKDISKANEWLGRSDAFAAPYGEYTNTTLDILKELNVKMAFTVKHGNAEPSQQVLEIPRISIHPAYTIEDFRYILEQQETLQEKTSTTGDVFDRISLY